MIYYIFQKINGKIHSVQVEVVEITNRSITIMEPSTGERFKLTSSFEITDNVVIRGAHETVIALYINESKLFPIPVNEEITIEEDDSHFLSEVIRGEVYNSPKINALLKKKEAILSELKKVVDENQIYAKLKELDPRSTLGLDLNVFSKKKE